MTSPQQLGEQAKKGEKEEMVERTAKQKQENRKETKNIVLTRGRIFEGVIVKLFPHRVVVENERTMYIQKYERFYKKKTKLHARVPQGMHLQLGDRIKIRECRPLSKIIHFIVESVIKKADSKEDKK
jgi:small subunit ribosomal protein S17